MSKDIACQARQYLDEAARGAGPRRAAGGAVGAVRPAGHAFGSQLLRRHRSHSRSVPQPE
jgi:hypothetical protein